MSLSYRTPAAFADFSCLGADCDDTCCRDWQVKLDKTHYELLQRAIEQDQTEQVLSAENIMINTSAVSGDHDYAFVRMRKDGYCSMLDKDGLCSIQSLYGIDTLGDVCTLFPRVISRCGDVTELSGSLSCPEVVRRQINAVSPLKMKRFRLSDLPRSKNYPLQRSITMDEEDDYQQYFRLVRDSLLSILANEDYSLNGRLYLLADLSHHLSAFYHRDCRLDSVQQLKDILDDYTQPHALRRATEFMQHHDQDLLLIMVVVHSILSIKLQQAADENISQLYLGILEGREPQDQTVPAQLAEILQKKINRLDQHQHEIIDAAVSRYLINCIFREWFISMPDSFTYIQMLLIRMMLLRSLIYLEIDTAIHDKEQLQEQLVYIMYNFARNIEQNSEFLRIVYNALAEQGMIHSDFSAAFIRF